jgi:hypothetical protein
LAKAEIGDRKQAHQFYYVARRERNIIMNSAVGLSYSRSPCWFKWLVVAGVTWATITPASAEPKITTQPASPMIVLAGRVTLRVAATGLAPLTFQWYFNRQAIESGTNASLAMTNVQRSVAGQYFATVGDSNGSTTSRVARVDVYYKGLAALIWDSSFICLP